MPPADAISGRRMTVKAEIADDVDGRRRWAPSRHAAGKSRPPTSPPRAFITRLDKRATGAQGAMAAFSPVSKRKRAYRQMPDGRRRERAGRRRHDFSISGAVPHAAAGLHFTATYEVYMVSSATPSGASSTYGRRRVVSAPAAISARRLAAFAATRRLGLDAAAAAALLRSPHCALGSLLTRY